MLLLGADGESVQVIDSAADLYPEQQNVDNEIESKRQAIYEQYRPVMNVDTGNITQLSNVAGTDSIAYVVKGKVVYDEDGNIDYDKSDDTIYYKVYDKDGNEVDGGTPKPIYLKTRRTEFGKVLSDVPIEEYVDNELYPQEQNNIRQAINNGPTNIEQSTPAESVTPNEYQEVTEKKDSTEFDENGGYSNIQNTVLSDEEADLLMSAMEDNAEAMPVIELTPDNWVAEFGQNRTVSTPIGDVKMGDNQLAKLFLKKRTREFGMIKPTLINPDVIIEKTAVADNAERNTKLLFAKTFKDENGRKHVHFENVTVQKGGLEVSISSHIVDKSAIRKELANGIVIYNKPELTSIGSDVYLTETHEGQSDLVPTQKANSDLQYKGTINNLNEQGEFYNSLPRNKKGEVDENQMSAEQKIMYAQIEFGQRADLVRDYVAEQSKALSEKIAKLTNKTGKSVAEYKELAAMQEDKNVFVEYLNEQRQQQEQATPRRMVEEAAAEREERRAAEKEQREQAIREKEEREGVPDFMQDTPEDARLRGFRLRTGERIDRQEPIEVSKYNTARRKFTNDTGAVEGGRPTVKRTIIDNAQTKLQPSHRGGRSNIYHFITEAQPKERTDKASRVSAAQIAANINPEEITGGITAYNGSPIANNRLEVIQGNNRAEALRLMYEEYPKSAEAYKQYLIDNAENYGMSADEVRSMKEPIAVDIYEGADGNAILLGQYTQQDVESGGVHRINPSGVVKHLKSHNMLDRFITTLLNGVGEDNTVSDVISSNLRGVLPILDNARAISLTQRQGFFDEKGDVTSGAIDDFKNILTSLITEGGYANINSDFLNLPESAKTALYLQTYRAILNQEYGQQILDEIQDSILLYTLVFGKNNKGKVGADEARREVMSWLMTAQPDFNTLNEDGTYPLVDMRERFSNFAAELAILYKSTNLRSSAAKGRGLYNIWEDFYNLLEGEGDLFTAGEKKSLQESINENFNIDYVPIRQNERNTLGGRGEASRAGRRGSESELGIGEQSEAGTAAADSRGRAEADIAEVGESRDVRYMTTDEINDRFNEELQQQIDGTLPKGHVYSLGMPNDILRSAGLPNLPIEMSAERLAGKSQQANHPFELSETEGLPAAIQHPIAIFDSTKNDGSSVILTELKHGDSNFVAILGVRQSDKQRKIDVEVNSIRSLYPKTHIQGIIDWFNSKDNLLRWVDKEKALNFISTQEPNYLAGGDNVQSTSSEKWLSDNETITRSKGYNTKDIAKVIKDFDNPTLSEEKNEETRLKASKRKARGATTEKLEELVTLLKKTGFADVKTGEDFYNALAEIGGSEHYLRPNGTVLGFVKGNTIYLNPDEVSLNTPIHEFGHLWVSQVKEYFPDLWAKGKELFLESDYLRKVQADPNYQHLDLDGQIDEAMARAIGDRGEQELDKTLLEKILDWIAEVWEKIGGVFGIDDLTSEQISNLTLQDFTDMATSELLSGQNLTERVNGNRGGATRYNTAEETADIKAKAISDGTFMKAPNGKDTNLTERQWLQVRTKAFKKWFGDWEKAYKLELIENLQPIGVDNKGLSREQAEEEYKKIGASKTNRYDNRRIEFVNNAFGKIARHKNSALILDIIPQLNDLFESAIPIYFEEEREPLKSTNIVGSHNYLGKVRVNDEDYYVRITAQELTPSWKQNEKQGKSNFHNMAVSDIAIYDESGSSVTAKDYSIDNDNRNRFVDAKLQHFFETAREARKNSSKVVDENGEPMVVYHGTDTRASFNKFKGVVHFFTENKDIAGDFGVDASMDKVRKGRDFSEYADEKGYIGYKIYETFLSLQNPFIVDADNSEWDEIKTPKEMGGKGAKTTDQIGRWAKRNGYDGVVIKNTIDANSHIPISQYIAFNSTQIKSATDNIGTFDGEDGDIRYMRPNGTVLGFVKGNTIYLNPDEVSLNTPIHEFGHLWVSQVKEYFPDLWAKGKELFLESDYLRKVQADPNYQHLDLDGQIDEAMARAIGDRGEQELDKTLLEKILDWIAEVWEKIGGVFGIDDLTSEQISNLTLQDFTDMATSELLSGQNLTERVNGNRGGATRYNTAEETADIKAKAISDGTFMKAPNGKDTNLTERQWLQVRTKAFKKWFGDWEKTARIEKLKKTKPIEITGEEYKGKYELNRDSAKSYIKDSLRGEYTNKDTGDTILLAKDGAQKVTSHSMGNEAHLKSIAVIPELIEKSIFIDELPNEKNNGKYDSYRYYVSGLKIGDVDYTVKLAIGIDEYGNKYYDHSLTEIEKGKLIDEVGALSTTLPSDNQSALSEYKDSKLISLLQTNSSKVVDENGEPMVVYHGTTNGLLVLVPQLIEKREDGSSWINNGKMREIADDYIQKHKKLPFTLFKQQDKAHKGTIEEFPNFWFTSDRKVAQTYAYTVRRTTGFKNNSEDKEIDEEGNLVEWVSKRKPPIAFYEVLKEGQRFDELNEDQLAEIKSIADKKGWILPYFPNRFWAYKILVPKDKLIDLRNREYEGYEFDYEGIKNRKEPYEDIYGEEFGYTGSFFLNIRTGEEVDFKGKKWSDTVRGKELNAYIRTSFKKNRDGLIAQNIKDSGSAGAENPANDYVVFSPTQIKSATDNIGTFDREDEDIRYSVGGADYFVNERFNEQLEKLTEENADSTIFYLGEPSAEMLAVGIKDSPLKLYGNKLQSKAKKHGFDVKDIKDLPEAIHDPIAIFEGAEDGSFAILTELSVGDNNVLATLSVGKGNDVDFNIVSSVYGKYNKNVVGWINKGKTLYVNKEKALDYLRISAPIAEAQDKGELVSATKVIENFENPPINEKKVIDDTTNDMVRYSIRANDQLDREDEIMGKKAAEIYEARVKLRKQMNQSDPKKMPNKEIFDDLSRKTEAKRMKFVETVADQYRAVKSFVDTLNKHGYNISDYNNWYMNVFALAGKNEAEFEKYQAERSIPLQRAAKAAMDSGKISYRELENYLILKHGQERNEYFTERDKGLGIEPLKDVDREDTRLY